MFNKIKDFWTNVIEVTREKAEEIREDMKKKITKSNPDVTIEWKDGQPEFKNKKDKPKK